MKVNVESINSVQSRVSLEIPAEQVDKAFLDALKKLQRKANIQGFRPGKAPLNMIKKLYSANVAQEVGQSLIQGTLFEALTENNIQPLASPVVDAQDAPLQGQEFKFSAVIDTLPVLDWDDYKGLDVEATTVDVTDENIQKELDGLLRRAAQPKDLDGTPPAAAGHMAVVSHKAWVDGKELENMAISNMSVALGQKELFEGLEAEILGMTKGETKKTKVTLPETYVDKDLAGKAVDFEIVLEDLKDLNLPELTDEFAKDMNFDSVDALRENIKKHLDDQAQHIERQSIENGILSQLVAAHPFEVPPVMVDQVIDNMIRELPHQTEDMRHKAMHDKELRERFRDEAKKRTMNTLILWHVAKKENMEVNDEDVEKRLDTTLAGFGMADADAAQKSKIRQQIEPRLRENLIFEKAMDFLIESSNIKKTAQA